MEARLHNWYPNLEILTHYVGAQSKMKFRCKRCGNVFERKALALMYEDTRPKYGCPKCDVRRRVNGTVMPLKLALKKIHSRFPDIEYVGGYTTFSKPATFKCKNCGKTFDRLPKQFIVSRSGCPHCVHRVWGSNRRKSPEQYQKEFSAKFPNLKLLTPYVNGRTYVKVKCNVCGNVWAAKPNALLRMKFGCKVCSSNHRGFGDRKSQKEFWTDLKKANPTILPLELYQGNKVPILVAVLFVELLRMLMQGLIFLRCIKKFVKSYLMKVISTIYKQHMYMPFIKSIMMHSYSLCLKAKTRKLKYAV